MGEQVIRRGHDTWVESARPSLEHGDAKYPQVKNNAARVLLFLPLEGIKGRTILSSPLTGKARGSMPAQTLTFKPIAEKWSAAWANWNKQPAVGTASATVTIPALTDGQQFSVELGALVQSIANGGSYFGWQITTNSATGGKFYGFDSGLDSWTLTVVTSDAPQTPTQLYPADGVVGLPKWVVSTDFTDLGGSTEMSSMQVQIDPAANLGTAWDSGEKATSVPELDLAPTTYPGLTTGSTTQWRARVKDGDGNWSDWSDWVSVTYVARPTIVLDNPSSGLLGDPSSTIAAHLSSGTMQAFRVQITAGDDKTRVRYDSDKRDGSTISLALPQKNDDGDRIFKDDHDYWLHVRAWDRLDRLRGGPGDPPYIELWQPLTFDEDVALAPVDSLTTTQVGDTPRVRLLWSRFAAADAWVVERDGEQVARLDPEDVTASGGTYEWVDDSPNPNQWNKYHVRALVNGDRSPVGPASTIKPEVTGVWLLADSGDVVLAGTGIGALKRADKRATYVLPNKPYDIDIIGALGGIAGGFEGTFDNRPDMPDTDDQVATLRKIRKQPTEQVRLVYGRHSFPVLLRDVNVDVSENYTDSVQEYAVSFYAWQVGEFDEVV